MFWILAIFALVFQLPTTTSSLFCLTCRQTLNASSSDVLNTTNCTNRTLSQVCKAVLDINHMTNRALMTFGEGSPDFVNALNGKNMIKYSMDIWLSAPLFDRTVELLCFNNNSCSEDLTKIYEKSKKTNYITLRNNLTNWLYNGPASNVNLTCANNEDQVIPCPNGWCELNSNGKSGFNRRCERNPFTSSPLSVVIEQYVVGEIDAESTFTYHCNKPMCNNKENAEKVRDLLKSKWLLTPAGVEPDPSNSAVTVLGQTSIILQCISMITMLLFSKYM